MDKIKGGLIVLVSVVYLLNLSGGFIEIPDNIPIVGNVDEFFFSALLVGGLKKYFNIDITGMVEKRLGGKSKSDDSE